MTLGTEKPSPKFLQMDTDKIQMENGNPTNAMTGLNSFWWKNLEVPTSMCEPITATKVSVGI